MPCVTVSLPHHKYEILIEPGLLEGLGELTARHAPHERCALMADRNVFDLHGARAEASLRRGGYQVVTAVIPAGEKHKSLQTVAQMYDAVLQHKLERRSPIVALGGGVIGDTVGFVASTYLRGVPFVQCPTSLLAMVDSSVGGKVGVNVPRGKNLIGSFYHPAVVVIDPLVLRTLPPRELRCGLAECVKHGVIRDESLFEFIHENMAEIRAVQPAVMSDLVRRNVAIKAAVVMEDEKENSVRAHLNFGHTFAHAIENRVGYGVIEHGEAVSLGMVAATWLAVELKMCGASLLDRLYGLLNAIGLPTAAELPETPALMEAMKLDKKVKESRIRFVLPDRMGNVVLRDDVPAGMIEAAWRAIRA